MTFQPQKWLKRIAAAALAAVSAFPPAALSAADVPSPAKAEQKPNVLFIAADDLNTRIGAFGSKEVKTPNIDRLASRGVTFQRAYCQYPLCNPSRTSLLSGLRPEETHILGNQTPPRTFLKDHVFLQDAFRQNGYAAWRVGKIYHGGGPQTGGFEVWDGAHQWDVNEAGKPSGKPGVAFTKHLDGTGTQNGLTWTALDTDDDGQTPDGATARRIAGLIDSAAREGKPFFAAAGFHKPHLPWVAPKKYFDLYDPAKLSIPRDPAGEGEGLPPEVLTWKDGKRPAFSDDEHREAIRAYYASISFTDAQVGVLLDTLDRNKLWDNTVVVFFGDHGFQLGEHGGWAKAKLWHQAIHAPLVVVAPGAKGNGSSSERVVEFVDLYPTLLDLAGLKQPESFQPRGTSLRPLLNDPQAKWDRPALTVLAGRREGKDEVEGRSVVTEQFHYIEWPGLGLAQLFDLKADPGEYTNLAADPKFATVVAEHKRYLPAAAATASADATQIKDAKGAPAATPDATQASDRQARRAARRAARAAGGATPQPDAAPAPKTAATGADPD